MMDVQKLFSFILVFLFTKDVHGGNLGLSLSTDGSYSITVAGKTWLRSGPSFFNRDGQRWSSDTDLVLQRTSVVSGGTSDDRWQETQFKYTYGNGTDVVMTAIRTFPYADYKIIFTQTFISASYNTSLGGQSAFNETMSGFPTFQVSEPDEPLGYLSFGGYMFGDTDKSTGRFTNETADINDGISGGPLALFNQKGQSIILSPYDNFMASSLWHDVKPGGHVTWGIMGGVNDIPANFTYRTILYYDESINNAFFEWGYELRKQFGIFNTIHKGMNQSTDVSLNYLGYWTDNGAYYYYHPENNKTFEETIEDVRTYADENKIPYKYVQLDSWWYPKDIFYNAVTSWTALSSVFPHGLKNLSESTGWKFVAHNRYWESENKAFPGTLFTYNESKDAVYAKQNNGPYDWIIGQYGSLPSTLEFWRFLFKQAKDWGLQVYEQDWLNIQTRYMAALQTNLTLGRDWLMQMGQAAAEQGLTIQYCMATARHAYQSLEIPTVTQARVSDDYQYLRPDQWKIGVTSLFAHAMAVFPSKDTFWTSTDQPGNPFNKTEPYPELEAAVTSLSKGPVGPSDKIGNTNMSLLMRCCREDGMLLKPSSSARAIDKQVIMDAFNYPTKVGEMWMAQSFIRTNGKDKEYGILLAADIVDNTLVNIQDLGFNVLNKGVYYPYNDVTKWKYFNQSTSINLTGCSKKNFCLFYFSPFLISSAVTAILGENDKWVPLATQRIDNVIDNPSEVVLSIKGTPNENVALWYISNGHLQQTVCTVLDTADNTTDCTLKAYIPSTSHRTTSSRTSPEMTSMVTSPETTSMKTSPDITTNDKNPTTPNVPTTTSKSSTIQFSVVILTMIQIISYWTFF